MLILVDGYNVIAPVAPPGKNPASDWLHRERMRLIDRLATQLDPKLASQTCVVFDATTRSRKTAGIGGSSESTFRMREIEVRYAVNHDEADDLIEELIALHSSPKRLTVVSSDHRLQAAARRSGATAIDSQQWLDSLLDGKLLLAISWPPANRDAFESGDDHGLTGDAEKSGAVDETTVEQWMQAFGIAKDLTSGKSSGNRKRLDKSARDNRSGGASVNTEAPNANSTNTPPATDDQTPDSHKRKSRKPDSKPPGDPRRIIEGDNPFPDGYGEDLL